MEEYKGLYDYLTGFPEIKKGNIAQVNKLLIDNPLLFSTLDAGVRKYLKSGLKQGKYKGCQDYNSDRLFKLLNLKKTFENMEKKIKSIKLKQGLSFVFNQKLYKSSDIATSRGIDTAKEYVGRYPNMAYKFDIEYQEEAPEPAVEVKEESAPVEAEATEETAAAPVEKKTTGKKKAEATE